MLVEVWLAFCAGVVGSIHCVGMCGGIVAAVAMAAPHGIIRSRLFVQLFYNLGRISTYTVLGAAAGLIGASLDLLAVRSVAFWFLFAANLFVVAVGLASLFGWAWFNLNSLETAPARFLTGPFRLLSDGTSPLASFPLGLCLGFLPCGLVYGPLMAAAGSGSPMRGGMIMAALGAGTLPVLLLAGSVSSVVSGAVRGRLFRLLGLLIALLGAAGLWRVLIRMGYLSSFPFR